MKHTNNIIYILVRSFAIVFLFASCNGNSNPTVKGDPDSTAVAGTVDTAALRKIDTAVGNGTYPNIHSVLVSKDGQLLYEHYWPGEDEVWATPAGNVGHAADSLHDIRSITKSIVSACIGIAIEQGKIKDVNQRVFDFFPEYKNQDKGLKAQLTIEHLLTMSSGLKWNEDVPYDNPANSEVLMIRSGNPIKYVLDQPMDLPPGKEWKYNGGTTQLLAAILQKTTGQRVDSFANDYLFKPLGIPRYEWALYPGTSLPAAASGLRLRSRDLLSFGLLYLNGGVWQGKQIVPASWVEASIQPHIKQGRRNAEYGYQFWLFNDEVDNKPVKLVACVGNGEQRILIDKERKLVIVATAGNYNKWDIKNNVAELSRNYIYPAIGN